MTTPHYEIGYDVHVYFDHSDEHVYGRITDIKRRFGYANDNTPIGNLVQLKIDKEKTDVQFVNKRIRLFPNEDNTIINFDCSFIVNATHPVGIVHRGRPVSTTQQRSMLFNHSPFFNRTVKQKKGYYHGFLSDLLFYAFYKVMSQKTGLRHQKEDIGLNLGAAGLMFLKYFAGTTVDSFDTVTIKKKVLIRWMQQNINRIGNRVSHLHHAATEEMRRDYEDYIRDLEEEFDSDWLD